MTQHIIDKTVDEKIDKKIEIAKLPEATKESVNINLPSNTTVEDDLRSKGQRNINMKWELTQQYIALYVVSIALLVSSVVVIRAVFYGVSDANLAIAAYTFISSTTSLIIGFYFSRTNHARIGDDPGKKSGGGLDDR